MPGKGSYLVHVGMFRQLATGNRGAHNSRMETGTMTGMAQEARSRTREKQEHERNGNRSGREGHRNGNEGGRDTVTERKDARCATTAGTEKKERNKTKAEWEWDGNGTATGERRSGIGRRTGT